MKRRTLLRAAPTLVATLNCPWLETLAAAQEGVRYARNGLFDEEAGVFYFTGIGRYPLRVPPEEAMREPRIAAAVPSHVAAELLRKMAEARQAPPNWTVRHGHREDLMISGPRGGIQVAENVVCMVNDWNPAASRRVWVVYHTDPQTEKQYRMTIYEECTNLCLWRDGPPIQCVCIPEWDMCRRS